MAQSHPGDTELLAYAEDELDSPRRGEVAGHVRTCAACAGQVRELVAAREALRASPVLRLPTERRARVLAQLPPPGRAPRPRRRLLALVGALLAVAALLAIVATQENGPPVGGQAEESAERAGPQAGGAERSGDADAPEAAAGQAAPLAQVEAPPSRVADFLRERGYEARVVDGAVEVRTRRPAAVRRLLNRRFARGGVAVYVR